MHEHTFAVTPPPDEWRLLDISHNLAASASSISAVIGGFSAYWTSEEMHAADEALQTVKAGIANTAIQHLAPPHVILEWNTSNREALPPGFPLCPILCKSGAAASLSNAWRMIDLAIDQMRAQWNAQEMRNCAAILCGALSLIESVTTSIRDQAEDEDEDTPPARNVRDHSVAPPTPAVQGRDFSAMSCELDDASSLLTDASCSMTAGWEMQALARCSAMIAGAKALIDRSRQRLNDADAAYVRRALEQRIRERAQP